MIRFFICFCFIFLNELNLFLKNLYANDNFFEKNDNYAEFEDSKFESNKDTLESFLKQKINQSKINNKEDEDEINTININDSDEESENLRNLQKILNDISGENNNQDKKKEIDIIKDSFEEKNQLKTEKNTEIEENIDNKIQIDKKYDEKKIDNSNSQKNIEIDKKEELKKTDNLNIENSEIKKNIEILKEKKQKSQENLSTDPLKDENKNEIKNDNDSSSNISNQKLLSDDFFKEKLKKNEKDGLSKDLILEQNEKNIEEKNKLNSEQKEIKDNLKENNLENKKEQKTEDNKLKTEEKNSNELKINNDLIDKNIPLPNKFPELQNDLNNKSSENDLENEKNIIKMPQSFKEEKSIENKDLEIKINDLTKKPEDKLSKKIEDAKKNLNLESQNFSKNEKQDNLDKLFVKESKMNEVKKDLTIKQDDKIKDKKETTEKIKKNSTDKKDQTEIKNKLQKPLEEKAKKPDSKQENTNKISDKDIKAKSEEKNQKNIEIVKNNENKKQNIELEKNLQNKVSENLNNEKKNLRSEYKKNFSEDIHSYFSEDSYYTEENLRSSEYTDILFEHNKDQANLNSFKFSGDIPEFLISRNQNDKKNKHLNKIYSTDDYIQAFFKAIDEENISALERFFIYFQTEYIMNKNLDNALIYAIKHKKNNILRYLLKRGFNLNITDKYGSSVLQIASNYKNFEALEILKSVLCQK